MDKKLESRIARLERLFASRKSVKNENRTTDLIDQIAMHLENALNEMRNFLALEEELGYTDQTIAETKRDIDTVQRIYETYL